MTGETIRRQLNGAISELKMMPHEAPLPNFSQKLPSLCFTYSVSILYVSFLFLRTTTYVPVAPQTLLKLLGLVIITYSRNDQFHHLLLPDEDLETTLRLSLSPAVLNINNKFEENLVNLC